MIRDVLGILICVTEGAGTVAFSISGALVAISCGFDLLGVIVLGCITAVGGGMIRDLLIGNTPPLIFFNYGMLLVALVTSALVFVFAYINTKKFREFHEQTALIINFFDAMGLASFSVAGVETAYSAGYSESAGVTIVMGVISGVGGGVLRDVLADGVPSVLTKDIYAVVSVLGCSVYYLIRTYTKYDVTGTIVVIIVMVIIRILAIRYHWHLPKVRVIETIEMKNGKFSHNSISSSKTNDEI